jgi:hypothetical protein
MRVAAKSIMSNLFFLSILAICGYQVAIDEFRRELWSRSH